MNSYQICKQEVMRLEINKPVLQTDVAFRNSDTMYIDIFICLRSTPLSM